MESSNNSAVDGMVSSMESMLCFRTSDVVKACSISGVPPQFRKSEKEAEAYKPKVVSIGPLYRGTKQELLHMEEIKYRCMMSLLHRSPSPHEFFVKCSEAMLALDMVFRTFYVDDIKFNSEELAKIMLLDGCFLLELFINYATQWENDIPHFSNSHLAKSTHDSSDSKHPAADVRKMEEVMSDLKLLGNQIPLHCLILLFLMLSHNNSISYGDVQPTVHVLALLFFGYSPSYAECSKQNRAHLLDLVHAFLTNKEIVEKSSHDSITLESSNSETKPELKFCAYRLLCHGIEISKIAPVEENQRNDPPPERVIFDCYKSLSFSEGILEIKPLKIMNKMEIPWRNFVAWEHNRIIHEKYVGGKVDPISCKFSEFALLLKGLVCCEHDIKKLKVKGVIASADEKWSNEDFMNFFRRIEGGIQYDTSQLYNKMILALLPKSDVRRRIFSLFWLWHVFRRVLINTRYKLREMFATLKRDHTPTVWKTIGIIAAIVLLFLTVAQTVLAAIAL